MSRMQTFDQNVLNSIKINNNPMAHSINDIIDEIIEDNKFDNQAIKDEIIKEQQDSMSEILSKKYFFHENINKNILQIGCNNFVFERDLNRNYDEQISQFKNKMSKKITVTDILCKQNKYNDDFKEQIKNIFNTLKENLSKKQLEIYNKFSNISFNYDDFKDVKIVDYKHTTSLTYKKIQNRLFNNEILFCQNLIQMCNYLNEQTK